MKKLFFLGFIALIAVSCNNKNSEKKADNEVNKTEEPKKEASLKDMIVGTWALTSVNGQTIPAGEAPVDFKFNADGTAEGAAENKSKWEAIEKDGKKYILLTMDNETEETEIKSIDDKTMVLIDKNDEIVLTKK